VVQSDQRRATPFYLSPAGDDRADGRSPVTAWQSLERANRQVFAPGDRLLLQGGARFPGSLRFDSADGGSPHAPVIVGSYGACRATIEAVEGPAIFVHNTAGIEIRDVVAVGNPATYRSSGGISFYSDLPGDRGLDHVAVVNVEVCGFSYGIGVGGGRGGTGFRDVRIHAASLHDNMTAGLATYGPAFDAASPSYPHQEVAVTRVQAYRNVGDATELARPTGSGIVLGGVRGARVEWSTAHHNGSACVAGEGPAGVWSYDSTGVVIQHNVSHHNRTGGRADGDGFDLDQNVSDSVLQHNRSYRNDGAGYLLYAGPETENVGNVVRFNTSTDDAGGSGWYGGITVAGRVRAAWIDHNTVVVTGRGTPRPPAVRLDGELAGVFLCDNTLVCEAAGPIVSASALEPSAVTLRGNRYELVS